MILNNKICLDFWNRINKEVASGQQFDYVTVSALKEQKITEGAKKVLGIPISQEMTLLDFNQQAIDILGKLRLIYLFSIIEAFIEEYIADREKINTSDITLHLKPLASAWMKQTTGLLNSQSFLNWSYLAFILKEKYKLNFSTGVSECFIEAGPLRNCLTHDNGIISDEIYRQNLQHVIKIEGLPNIIGSQIKVGSKLIWTYIEDARKIIELCDY